MTVHFFLIFDRFYLVNITVYVITGLSFKINILFHTLIIIKTYVLFAYSVIVMHWTFVDIQLCNTRGSRPRYRCKHLHI